MKKYPLVSIVIPTHNRKKSVVRLIHSILQSTYKELEIIVVDDFSVDGTVEYIRSKISNKNIKVVRNNKNLFTAGTRNVGQKLSHGEYILFIDDDNVIDRKMIEKMVEIFVIDKKIGEVGPINYSYKKKSKVFWAGTYRNMFTTKTYHLNKIQRKKYWDTPDVPNAFMVRGEVVKRHKIYFDSLYGIMYEESDYAYRIRQEGYGVVVCRDAKIYHDIESYTNNGKTKDYMYHFMSDVRRPYVFARNRIIFHKRFSRKVELVGILMFWVWFFNLYYNYKYLFYNGVGTFTFSQRVKLALSCTKGTIAGCFKYQ
ncbi:MAG TPA: glycosyltransferase family 2 protein [Candidatus Levybacteria bacterium]|nr:glycosyltransferase family 2 protein [Candidatus Levybacteria bacterium]